MKNDDKLSTAGLEANRQYFEALASKSSQEYRDSLAKITATAYRLQGNHNAARLVDGGHE